MTPEALVAMRDAIADQVAAEPSAEAAAALYDTRYFPASLAAARAHAAPVDALVLTVGAQPYSVALSLALNPADEVVAIVTALSRRTLHQARRLAEVPAERVREVEVDKADAVGVYRAVRDALRGRDATRVVADFTSGSKAMTAGLSSAAGYLGLTQRYVESAPLGHRLFGRERWHTVEHPVVVFGDVERDEAERAFNAGRYEVAEALFADLARRAAPGRRYDARALVCRGLLAARALQFADAAARVREAVSLLRASSRSALPDEPLLHDVAALERRADVYVQLHTATSQEGAAVRDPALFLVLLRYLLARAREETPDLRTLLHYRALELVMQRRQAVWLQLDTEAPAWASRPELAAQLAGTDVGTPDDISLFQGLQILDKTGDPVRAAVSRAWPAKQVMHRLKARNKLLWAHGFSVPRDKFDGAGSRRPLALEEPLMAHVHAACRAEGLHLPDPDPDLDRPVWGAPPSTPNLGETPR